MCMNQTRLLLPVEDEAKVRFHNKPPPPKSLINPLTSSLLLSFCLMTNYPFHHKNIHVPSHWCSCPLASPCVPFPLSSLSTCVFSSCSLWNLLCPSPLCWCCSDRKTHPPPAALSLSLPDSHWLPVRGDITLLLCLPASLLLCSLPRSLFTSVSVDSDHSFIGQPPLHFFALLSSIYCLCSPLPSCS